MSIKISENLTPQAVTPLMQAMLARNDSRPDNSLPIDTQGTIQQNADKVASLPVTLYNAHGILLKDKPNSLLAHA